MSANKDNTRLILMGETVLSGTMSLLWVGFYGYTYNDPFYNSSPVNWLAFLLWAPGLFLTMKVYWLFTRHVGPWLGIVLTWLAYFISLLLIEHIGYNVLAIRQVTSEGPLLFGLIHGTAILKTYYIAAGVFAVLLSKTLRKVSGHPGGIKEPFGNGKVIESCRYDYHKEFNKAL